MIDPNKQLTNNGAIEALSSIANLQSASFFLTNHEDELELNEEESIMMAEMHQWAEAQLRRFSLSYKEHDSGS